MGRSGSKWSKFIRRVFGPLTGCETKGPVHAKPKAKKRTPKSLRILTGIFSPSNNIADDASSFMSPMPNELCSRLTQEDKSPMFLLNSEDSEDGSDRNGDEYDSVRLSFIRCADIIDLFPETPVSSSQTLQSRRSKPSQHPTPTSPLHGSSNIAEQAATAYHPFNDSTRRALTRVHRRNQTPPRLLFCQGSSQTSCMYCDDLPSIYQYPSYFYALRSGLTSTQGSPQSSGSPLLPSPSINMPPRSNASSSSIFMPNHLSTNPSLQDMSEPTSPLSSPPSSPSSLRSATSRVPGLERRVPGSPRRRFDHNHDSVNSGGGHVPYATTRF